MEPPRMISFEQTECARRELPRGRLVWVEQCGHCAHLEQSERLAELVCEFMGPVPATNSVVKALEKALP